jgi:hypothetical protein
LKNAARIPSNADGLVAAFYGGPPVRDPNHLAEIAKRGNRQFVRPVAPPP